MPEFCAILGGEIISQLKCSVVNIQHDFVVTSLVAPKAQHLGNGLRFILIVCLFVSPAAVPFCFGAPLEYAVLVGYFKWQPPYEKQTIF